MMAFTCHISCGDSKKIVKFSSNLPDDIYGEIKKVFGLPVGSFHDIKLEKYDEEWDDWVDISVYDLKQGLKLKVLTNKDLDSTVAPLHQSPAQSEHSVGSASTVLLDDSSREDSLQQLNAIFDLPPTHYATFACTFPDGPSSSASSSIPDHPSPGLPPRESSEHSSEELTESSQDDGRDKESKTKEDITAETLPAVLKFTSLPKRLVEKLDSATFPDERERRQIVSYVYNDMASYVVYPTSWQYNKVASSLVERFPVLSEGSFSTTPYHYWKTRLMDKFRNERRNLPLPQKRKLPSSKEKPSSKDQKMELPDGEDASSQSRHQRWLQSESKKKKQDTQKASLLMQKTFVTRREDIVKHPEKLSVWKGKYPFLFDTKELHAEFLRITGRNCNGLRKAIAPFAKIVAKADELVLSLYQKEVSKCQDADKLADLQCIASLLTLPKMFKEALENILVLEGVSTSEKPLNSQPVILCSGPNFFNAGKFYIKTEDEHICSPTSLVLAFECLMATYYTFNMSFNPKAKNTLIFLDLLLGLKTKGTLPRSISTFITKYKDM